MQVVILAGGLGTRIQSVAAHIPKSLIPVAGQPFVVQQLALLKRNGLSEVLMCVGHLGEQIVDYVGDGHQWGMRVAYSFDEPGRLLGTGGALLRAAPLLQDAFMVLYGDSYLPTDYQAIIQAFMRRGAGALMCVFKNHGRWDASNVRVEHDQVVFYSKQAQPGEVEYIDYGISVFKKSVLMAYAAHAVPLDLQVILQDQVRAHALAAFEVHERFYEIGKPAGLRECEEFILRQSGGA